MGLCVCLFLTTMDIMCRSCQYVKGNATYKQTRGYIMEHTLQKTSACGLGEETEVFFEDVFELNICVWFVIGFEI